MLDGSVQTEAIDVIGGRLAAAALDQMRDLTVVIDGDGTIVLTNAAWRTASERRGADDATTGCGVNYLEICERGDATTVAAGLRAVLAGEVPRFEFDYPFNSPLEDAWYSVEVLALGEPGTGAVVTHTDVTARVGAARPRRPGGHLDPVTLLATSPAGVTGLARLLADAQSHGNSLAVVTVTLSDLAEIESGHGRRSRDEVVVQAVARLRRLTRADDEIFRPSTNQLVVVASVADSRGGEFFRERIADVLEPAYLVGADVLEAPVVLSVTSSDQFSTLESLFPGFGNGELRSVQGDAGAASGEAGAASAEADSGGEEVDVDAAHLPLMVYSLPDGYLQAANDAARSLFGLTSWPDRAHVRDITNPADLRHAMAALSALGSGATDSYRARRTLQTDDGELVLLTSVRRLVVGRRAFAVALAVPADPEDGTAPAPEGAFSAALVVGTIRANGAVVSVSSPGSPMEAELVAALGDSLEQAAHPDEADLVSAMLESMRLGGRAAGALRILHAEHGWVVCQCKLFRIRQNPDDERSTGAPVVGHDPYGFVLSANVSSKSMIDRIARLERHIRRIGSEVSAADLELGVRPTTDQGVTTALDALEPTARQRDIVERLARGQRVSSIAAELFISRSTVRNHLAQVYRLAGVHSQDELLDKLRRH